MKRVLFLMAVLALLGLTGTAYAQSTATFYFWANFNYDHMQFLTDAANPFASLQVWSTDYNKENPVYTDGWEVVYFDGTVAAASTDRTDWPYLPADEGGARRLACQFTWDSDLQSGYSFLLSGFLGEDWRMESQLVFNGTGWTMGNQAFGEINGLPPSGTRMWDAPRIDAVPEPMSIFLGIMGLGSIAGFRRFRK